MVVTGSTINMGTTELGGGGSGNNATNDEWAAAMMEGVDFGLMAREYSDDSVTARGDGRLATPIKQRGAGLDPDFRDAAWSLMSVGDICAPVKSVFGWHVIKLDDHKKPARKAPDFTQGTHRQWLLDEYETEHMKSWLKSLRKGATIKKVSKEEIFALKNRSYWKDEPKKETAPGKKK